jgi:hypothetical protein
MYLQTLFEKARSSSDDTSAAIFGQLLDALEHDAPFDLQQLTSFRTTISTWR